ncbi:MAG: COX15/CtaA family protein [Phycisphaerales bacterium]|nr:COX15/CtaA family protein [Phycisphaerales bacterium]
MAEQNPGSNRGIWPAITLGFAAAVTMWTIGFLFHLPGLTIPPPVVAGALIAALAAWGFISGRLAGPVVALGAGFTAGLVCLLILGSLLANEQADNSLRPGWPILVVGWLIAAAAVAGIGGFLGARTAHGVRPQRDWHSLFAIVAAASVLPLIVIGGLVTSYDAGLAVPDWPNSYGANMFLYPLARMTGGIYYEHAHRLFGSLVGLTTLVFTVYTLLVDRRAVVKAAALALFVLVVAQGVFGGIRVTNASLALAMVHGVTGQLFFAAMCVMAAACTVRWKSSEPRRQGSIPGSPRRLAATLVCLLVVQLVFGAMLRHLGPVKGAHAMMSHIANAVIVLVIAIGAGVRGAGAIPGDGLLRRLGKGTMHAAFTQFILGGAALWAVLVFKDRETPPAVEAAITTAHQALGALLLAMAAMLAAWSRRLILPRSAPQAPLAAPAAG